MNDGVLAMNTRKALVEDYFHGRTRAWGVFEDRFGKVRRHITIDLVGRRDGDAIIVDEDFHYADGETEQRTWDIRQVAAGVYEGRTQEIDGIARGQMVGNAIHWKYKFNLLVGKQRRTVTFREWMEFQDGGKVLHRAYLSKWGVRLGTVTLVYQKV
jgi:hypothetical protein